MNYHRIHNQLIDRARLRGRVADLYMERHHVVPRCMGGTNAKDNLVWLTPEEHYVIHQLLVKMYRGTEWYPKLVYAANMMAVGGEDVLRSTNKRYGWLRRERSRVFSVQYSGINAPMYGKRGTETSMWGKHHTVEWRREQSDRLRGNQYARGGHWYTDGVSEGKYDTGNQPSGWHRGRLPHTHGRIPWNKGVVHTSTTKALMRKNSVANIRCSCIKCHADVSVNILTYHQRGQHCV